MIVLIDPGTTPTGFGLAQDGASISIITPCCGAVVTYHKGGADPTWPGVPGGSARLSCKGCGKNYKGFSDTFSSIGMVTRNVPATTNSWVQYWTGLTDVVVEVTYE